MNQQTKILALMELTFDQRETDNKQKLISKISRMLAGDQYCGKKKCKARGSEIQGWMVRMPSL